MSSLPFENHYKLRKVAEGDSRGCFICYKPTPGVLVSIPNQKDFFYICLNHLKDTRNFCTPIYGPERAELIDLLKEKQDQCKILEFQIKEKSKYSAWSKLLGKGEKPKTDTEEEGNKDENSKSDSEKAKKKDLEELKFEAAELKKSIVDLEKNIAQTENNVKQFALNKDIFKIRLVNHQKKAVNQKKLEQIQSGLFFPDVPVDAPGTPSNPKTDSIS